MSANKFVIAAETIDNIAQAEAEIAGLKANSKANNEAANASKIGAYAELISSLAGVKLTKGNLPRAVSKKVKEALLVEGGCKEATAKRYLENSVGALRHFDFASQATPAVVLEMFEAEGVTSENKLAKLVKGDGEKTKAQLLAEKVVGKWSQSKDENGKIVQGNVFRDGLDDAELDEFQNIMRELMAAREAYRNTEAAKAAEASAADENGAVDAAVAAFTEEVLGAA